MSKKHRNSRPPHEALDEILHAVAVPLRPTATVPMHTIDTVPMHTIDTVPTPPTTVPTPPTTVPTPPTTVPTPPTTVPAHAIDTAPATKPGRKLFFTGRMCAGKDYVAAMAKATIFGFADPIYAIAETYFGVTANSREGKELPGMRAFLQCAGEWGKGTISPEYPLNTTRALFLQHMSMDPTVAQLRHRYPEVDWSGYGHNPDIWLNAGIARANGYRLNNPTHSVAITNCRFPHEFQALREAEYSHWHVLCSPATWAARLAQQGLTPQSPEANNYTEAMAVKLGQQITKEISLRPEGPKIRVVWNDPGVAPPSPRFHTVASFLETL